jgi:hypothetical protein
MSRHAYRYQSANEQEVEYQDHGKALGSSHEWRSYALMVPAAVASPAARPGWAADGTRRLPGFGGG